MKKLNQSGSHLVAVVVGLLVVVVIGFAGYTVANRNSAKSVDSGVTITHSNQVPSAIKNTADLNKAAQTLDSSTSQVNASLNDSQLDSDLNDML